VSLTESLVIIGLWIIPKIPKIPAECGFIALTPNIATMFMLLLVLVRINGMYLTISSKISVRYAVEDSTLRYTMGCELLMEKCYFKNIRQIPTFESYH